MNAYPGIDLVYGMFEYPLTQLENYGENPTILSDIKDERAAYIFALFVREHLTELIGMAKELDEEYAA